MSPNQKCMIFLLVIICFFEIVTCLDVSWIPNDPDGPLPLSSNYRNALGKLCVLISSGQTLPPEIKSKLVIIEKLCSKLRSSEGLSWVPWETFNNLAKNLPIYKILATLTIAGLLLYILYIITNSCKSNLRLT